LLVIPEAFLLLQWLSVKEPVKAYRVRGSEAHPFYIWGLDRAEWSAAHSCRFILEERADTDWVGGWAGRRNGLETLAEISSP
jgi:hypothetical protein